MKAYALHLGDTRVPFGQFYGGGSSGRDVLAVLRDRTHNIIVPVYAYLVDHPRHGPIMINTGLNWQQAHAHREYYSGPLLRLTFDEDEYLMAPEQRLEKQLARIGLSVGDIGTVVLTHLHEDHLGGVRQLLGARFLVSRADWNSRNIGIFPFRRTPSLKGVLTDPELIDFTSGPFGPRSDPAHHARTTRPRAAAHCDLPHPHPGSGKARNDHSAGPRPHRIRHRSGRAALRQRPRRRGNRVPPPRRRVVRPRRPAT